MVKKEKLEDRKFNNDQMIKIKTKSDDLGKKGKIVGIDIEPSTGKRRYLIQSDAFKDKNFQGKAIMDRNPPEMVLEENRHIFKCPFCKKLLSELHDDKKFFFEDMLCEENEVIEDGSGSS